MRAASAPERLVEWINGHVGLNPRAQQSSDALCAFVADDLVRRSPHRHPLASAEGDHVSTDQGTLGTSGLAVGAGLAPRAGLQARPTIDQLKRADRTGRHAVAAA